VVNVIAIWLTITRSAAARKRRPLQRAVSRNADHLARK
jgi:hypothetical protein